MTAPLRKVDIDAPLTVNKARACAVIGISPARFDDWRRRGILPPPIAGTRQWSLAALRRAIDDAGADSPEDEAEAALRRWEDSQAS